VAMADVKRHLDVSEDNYKIILCGNDECNIGIIVNP
jgi:hypothetical protein